MNYKDLYLKYRLKYFENKKSINQRGGGKLVTCNFNNYPPKCSLDGKILTKGNNRNNIQYMFFKYDRNGNTFDNLPNYKGSVDHFYNLPGSSSLLSKDQFNFDNASKVFIFAQMNGTSTYNGFRTATNILLGNSAEPLQKYPHITIHNFFYNPLHSGAYLFQTKEFQNIIEQSYNHLRSIVLKSRNTDYKILGDSEFIARVYHMDHQFNTQITKFRMGIYNYLQENLGKYNSRKIQNLNGDDYMVYFYQNKPLIAIHNEHYHGKGNWTPHLSLIKKKELQDNNYSAYNDYEKSGSFENKARFISDYLYKKNNRSDIEQLRTIALDSIKTVKLSDYHKASGRSIQILLNYNNL